MGLPLNQVVPNCGPNMIRSYHPLQNMHVSDKSNSDQRSSQYFTNVQLLKKFKVISSRNTIRMKIKKDNLLNQPAVLPIPRHNHTLGHRKVQRPSTLLRSRGRLDRLKDRRERLNAHIIRIQDLRNSYPIISNMPLISIQNSSVLFINDSPFALRDRRFGILHHPTLSETYFN